MRLRRRLVIVAAAIALLTAVPASLGELTSSPALASPLSAPAAASPRLRSACWRPRTSERSFARRINAARSASGVAGLRFDPQLSRVARYHTWQMAHKKLLFHTPSPKLTHRVTHWVVLGENVGVGGSVDSLHTAFMNSPEHRDNILLPAFNHVGIGATKRGDRMWVTVLFEAATNPGTSLRMPTC